MSPVWSKLVDNWAYLTHLIVDGLKYGQSPGMYKFMKELGC